MEYEKPYRYEVNYVPESHLAKAILTTILCCMPLGVVAIVYAAQVNGEALRGNIEGAETLSRKADNWGNASLIVGLIPIALWLLAALLGAAGVAGGLGALPFL